ncbi:MAG: outer membrane protein assembly factor BamE [Proteobacteria bacterium]|nr:outer membrane protein assembly factor BamE [Pseudomonadota bacterium]
MQKFCRRAVFLSGVCLLLMSPVACSPIVATRGNLLSQTKFEQVQPNVSHRADVVQYWGPPTATSPFNPNIWYYIGETTSQKGVFAPKVDKRRIIRVKFDPNNNDTVVEVADLDSALAKDVKPVSRTTPAAGKDFTALQQFIGNLGKYNAAADKDKK